MKKIVKKIGNSLGIIFDREDCKIYELKEGDILEFSDDVIKIFPKKGAKVFLSIPNKIGKILEEQAKAKGMKVEDFLKKTLLDKCKKVIKEQNQKEVKN